MEFGDLSDNPFSIDLIQTGRGKRNAVKSAVKLLVVVAIGFSITLAVTKFTPRWLVQQYAHEFDSQSSEEKRRRLIQLADLGEVAIEAIVHALADQDLEVAQMAYGLLAEQQNDWTIMTREQRQRCHIKLARAVQGIAVYLPDNRTGWASTLLQASIQSTVNRRDDDSRLVYEEANRAMGMLAISDRSGPSILDNQSISNDQPSGPSDSRLLIVRSDPLPVGETENGRWTDWPPPSAPETGQTHGENANTPINVYRPAGPDDQVAESPSVYRSSSARLRPVDPDEPVVLYDIDATNKTGGATQVASDQQSSLVIQQASHIMDSPMGAFDDRSVMHWLGSQHAELRQKAREELTRRGFSEREIAVASQVVSGDRQTRLALIDAIARFDQVDPRPWLMMMLDDESRDVKLRAISVLATMNDPAVNQQLRIRVTEERDPTVAARIRRVLNLR